MEQPRHRPTLNALWREYRTLLHRYVSKRVTSQAEAEDIVHDVLLRVYAKRDTLEEVKHWKAWLYTIARNAIVDHYRKHKPTESLPETLLAEEPEPSGMQELVRCVLPLIKELPPKYREPLELADLDGWPQKSVAEKLELSLSGAKSRVQRGRHLLKDMFFQCCQLEYDSLGHIASVTPSANCTKCGCASRI